MNTAPTITAAANAERIALARRTLVHALLLGAAADGLLRNPPWGIGLLAWMLLFAGALVSLSWSRNGGLTREQRGWLFCAVLFSAGFAWRDAESLLFYDFLAMLLALALLSMATSMRSRRTILGTRVRDVAQSLMRTAGDVAIGVVPLAAVDSNLGAARRSFASDRPRALIRATIITVPLILFFGVLLGQADPVFGSIFRLPQIDLGVVASHVFVTGFFTWIVGGWMRGALVDRRERAPLADELPFSLGALEITIALGALALLFAMFVGVQVGWLFGGERLVRSTTGLGYAQYARRGFFELVWVSLLVLPVLLGTRAAIPAGDASAMRRHGRLSIPIVLLIGAIMASALGRMWLYVHYYGLTTDRLYASVFMGWLAIVFGWYALTVLRNRARDFAAGMTITGFATLAALNVANPEAFVARINVERAAVATAVADSVSDDSTTPRSPTPAKAAARSPIDYAYLSRLSGDAADVVSGALVSQPIAAAGTARRETEVRERCDAVKWLITRWGTKSTEDWRRWSLGDDRARTAVRARERELRAVTCWDNGGEAVFGDRERRATVAGEQGYVAPPARP